MHNRKFAQPAVAHNPWAYLLVLTPIIAPVRTVRVANVLFNDSGKLKDSKLPQRQQTS
jgi:hypothetical protein